MSHLLSILFVFGFHAPAAKTFRATTWQPTYVETANVELPEKTVALLTHCSQRFDPLAATQPAVSRVVRTMKREGGTVLYLHDKYNPGNPPWMYLYDDWQPTAYVRSDIGHIQLNLSNVSHVICLGGYFGQCERATVSDVVNTWVRGDRKNDLRLTQIVDGTFTVAQHVKWEDSYREIVRHQMFQVLRSRHKDAVLTVADVLEHVSSEQQAEFLERQLPMISADVNIVLDCFGKTLTLQRASERKISNGANAADVAGDEERDVSPTLTFAFRRSDDFLNFNPPEIDDDAPRRWVRGSRFRVRSGGTTSSPRPAATKPAPARPAPLPPAASPRVIVSPPTMISAPPGIPIGPEIIRVIE